MLLNTPKRRKFVWFVEFEQIIIAMCVVLYGCLWTKVAMNNFIHLNIRIGECHFLNHIYISISYILENFIFIEF